MFQWNEINAVFIKLYETFVSLNLTYDIPYFMYLYIEAKKFFHSFFTWLIRAHFCFSLVVSVLPFISCPSNKSSFFVSLVAPVIYSTAYIFHERIIFIQRIIYIFNERIISIQRIILYSTNYLHIQRNNYFHSANQIYLFNEWIEVLLFNQIVIKYMVSEI